MEEKVKDTYLYLLGKDKSRYKVKIGPEHPLYFEHVFEVWKSMGYVMNFSVFN